MVASKTVQAYRTSWPNAECSTRPMSVTLRDVTCWYRGSKHGGRAELMKWDDGLDCYMLTCAYEER